MAQYNNFNTINREINLINKKLMGLYGAIGNISSTANITMVDNYNLLPSPVGRNGEIYGVTTSIGTSWLPGWLGGSYYPKGFYYSNDVEWVYMGDFPTNATQEEVNAGIIVNKFVAPSTLKGWWDQLNVPISKIQGLQAELNTKADASLIGFDIDKIELELKLSPDTLSRHKIFSYNVGGNLVQIDTYDSILQTVYLFRQVFNYSGETLTSQVVTRMTDGFIYAKSYIYDGNGNLTNITVN